MSAAESYKGGSATRFASVRFGNVIGSRGSLVPLIRGQVARGGPVTLTDPEMTRYMMPVNDAVRLCFRAMERMQGGEVFILKMSRIRVGDLVEVLIEAYALQFGYRPDQIRLETIGARPGEKKHEVLLTEDEALAAHEVDGMFVVSALREPRPSGPVRGGRSDEPLLDRTNIRDLLDQAGWLTPELLPALGQRCPSRTSRSEGGASAPVPPRWSSPRWASTTTVTLLLRSSWSTWRCRPAPMQ